MKKENNKKSASALIGAAFLMATSAIGPGFLTQTGKFTDSLHGSFGFVILISVILAAIVQLNVWRVLCVSGMRGQDVANKVLPGLGYVIAFLVVAGGLVFNIGNVGGGALGFNTLLGIPTTAGYFLAGAIAVLVFLFKNALKAMDTLTKVLGGLMIAVIFVVILIVRPPVGYALKETVAPSAPMGDIFPAILTLLGGTVGGYITFAGAHRLIDAGITKKENLKSEKVLSWDLVSQPSYVYCYSSLSLVLSLLLQLPVLIHWIRPTLLLMHSKSVPVRSDIASSGLCFYVLPSLPSLAVHILPYLS